MKFHLLLGCLFLFAAAIIESGATRANDVVDAGVSARAPPVQSNYSFLQKHVAFFDRDNDGVVYPEETIEGLRAIGISLPVAMASAPGIHATSSLKTRPGKLPSARLPIEIANIALAKHGSDTDIYDDQGNFVESRFEETFNKYARKNPNAWTWDELMEMVIANKDLLDLTGQTAATVEWGLLYEIAKDKDGLLQKETIRACYDGSLFHTLEKQHKSEG